MKKFFAKWLAKEADYVVYAHLEEARATPLAELANMSGPTVRLHITSHASLCAGSKWR